MKQILITGENSYVGNAFDTWLSNNPDLYSIDKVSMRDRSWKKKDFSPYDVVVHVAGIAHVSTDPDMEEKYYRVNRDLTIEVAEKAKADGVKQFIFLSSLIVYGENITNNGIIDMYTTPAPSNFYGDSKLQAENQIKSLNEDSFKVVILRPPMIYGKGSKGNYPKLAKAARKLPVFPNIDNQRSMLHIDNLCEFMKLMIDNQESGMFFPQNKEYVNTSEMVCIISEIHNKKIKLVKLFNPILILMQKKVGLVNKVFGNMVYEKSMSRYKEDYQIRDFRESIKLTER
ncbi:NAD-dependent epimerase/dehydratase family protein [Sporosarcina sp. 6E9]|uniref:NAD-dependent epimerase/dehydratase family protein n=1 Tax=Sporosarcina sp. 6E9 TaxID=2819235 RepID=UPI001B30BEA7|nr:NAD-dependent epimerase/dehydratase family protein [Sporosarcina sp. 6E9]